MAKPSTLVKHTAKIKKLKLLIFDVDGVLTDGTVTYAGRGEWTRSFDIRDGFGLYLLVKKKFPVAIITASKSEDIDERMKTLGITDVHTGTLDKWGAYQSLLTKYQVKPEQVAYMADDLFDLPILKDVGFAVAPPEAVPEVLTIADYVTKKSCGAGAAREFIDAVRHVHRLTWE